MIIESLNLSHQNLLENRLKTLNLLLSEYCFANLFLFREIHQYELVKIDEDIFIKGKTRDQQLFIMLTTHPSQISPHALQQALSLSQMIFPVPEMWIDFFDKKEATFKDEDSDYIYKTTSISQYQGRHLDGQRNHVKKLFDHYDVNIEAFSSNSPEALKILDQWQEEIKSKKKTDYLSCKEAIQNMEQLKLDGTLVYVNGQPAGFAIGERLNENCYAIHFAKATHSFKGVYQLLFKEQALIAEKQCPWINFEQDLGIPSLRSTKLSYHPEILLKKWRIQMRELQN